MSGNKGLLLSKTIFFIVYAAASVFLPFMALYLEQRGLSGRQIGVLAGIPPVMTMIGASVWGGLSDATRRHKQVFILVIAGSIVAAVLLPLTQSFAGLGLVIALHALCFMPLIPLLDNTALDILGKHSDRYGQIRLWGSIGWGVGAPMMGPLLERFGLGFAFYGHAVLMLLGLLVAVPLPVAQTSAGKTLERGCTACCEIGAGTCSCW